MLNKKERIQKRVFDIFLSLIGILLTGWLMFIAWFISSIETRSNGLFMQERIGIEGKSFLIFKIKTMKKIECIETTVTVRGDSRVTKSGVFLRRTKIDELPQFFNVLMGKMSFVGPRPDVAGFADNLIGDDRIILKIRPAITGPASLKYKDEETILSQQEDAYRYNKEVIWPDKVTINKAYIKDWSFKKDIGYIIQTIRG